MLSKLMVEKWLEKEVQDVNQMNLHLQDRDFKVYSESQNLKEKSLHLDKVKEYNAQSITVYSYNKSTDWANWFSGTFYVP
jgi:flagellar basal body P-ring protein FlgI